MALDFIAGCFGGCAGIIVGHPLDTVKVRLQTQDNVRPMYKGTFDCFRKIVKYESVSGLFKGVTAPLGGIAVINAIVFGVYGNLQRNLPEPDSMTSHFIAGTVAGVVQSFICSPMELAKTRIQIRQERTFQGPLHTLLHIHKSEGLRGVFRGLNLTLLREGLSYGVYFSSYEWLTRGEVPQGPLGVLHLLAAGGTSGAASWLFTYPLDVIKSRIQADEVRMYKNGLDCLLMSVKSEGLRCLFRGLGPTLVRAFPTNATTWAVVTWIMNMAKTEQKQELADGVYFYEFVPTWRSHDFCLDSTSYFNHFADERWFPSVGKTVE